MQPKDIIGHITSIAAIAAAAVLVILGKMPWFAGVIVFVAFASPSSLPALVAAAKTVVADDKRGPSILGGVLLICAAMHVALGCGPAVTSATAPAMPAPCAGLDNDTCSAKYEGELTACAAQSQTLAQSQACEDSVRKAYGRPPLDAGAPPATGPSDAGTFAPTFVPTAPTYDAGPGIDADAGASAPTDGGTTDAAPASDAAADDASAEGGAS